MASPPNLTLAQCLARSSKVVLSGSRTTQYRDSSGANDRTYDFRGLSVNMLDAYNVLVGNGSAGTANCYRPAVIGSVQDATLKPTFTSNNTQSETLGWDAAYHPNGDCLFVRAEDWAIIDGYRSHNADDAISIRSNGHRQTFFSIRNCYVTHCRDDAIEDDTCEPGEVVDSLFDGTFVFLSQRPDASDPFATPPGTGDVITIDRCLVRLEPTLGTTPQPNANLCHILWKWDVAGCRVVIKDSVFVVPTVSAYGTSAMKWPTYVTCQGTNYLLYGGGGAYPATLPSGLTVYTTDTPTTYAQALASIWDVRRKDWLVRHGLQTGTPSTSVASLDVSPNTGTAPLSVTADASASTGVSGTNPYTFSWGDGTADTGPQSGATATHTYNTPGTFTARVTTLPGPSTATDTVTASAVPSPPAPEWRVSANADRSASTALSGAILKGTRYAFIGNDTGIASSRNFVDDPSKTGAAYSTDTSAPFDLVPGGASSITYQGTATSATTGSGTASSLAISYPASIQANEVLVACVCNRTGNQAPIVGPGGGWTEAPNSPIYKGNSIALSVWYKVATGSESGSATWTTLFGGNPVVTKLAGGMARFSGVDTATPFHVTAGQAEGTTPTTTHSTPSITTTLANCMLLELFSDRGTSTWTPPSGNSETERIDVTTTGSADVSLEYVTSTTVATGSYQKTATASASSQYACMWIGALKPGSSGTATGFDTTVLSDGFHELTAELTDLGDAVLDVGARFQVQNAAYALQASYASDRKSPFGLAGATVSGQVYVFLQPDADVSQVEWWLDNPAMTGLPLHVDPGRPFDFIGSDQALGSALPWDTSNLAGPHTISARVTRQDASTATLTTAFTVGIDKFISGGTAVVSTPASAVDVPVPSGLQAGVVLLAAVTNRSGLAITLPSGWTHASGSPIPYGNSLYTVVCYKAVTDPASEPATYQWNLGGSAATTNWCGVISAWRGLSTTAPVHVAASLNETEALTDHVTAAVTPTELGCWLVSVFAERLVAATPSGWTSTDTERADLATTPPSACDLALYDSGAGVPAGSPLTRTGTSGNASQYVSTWIGALRPSTTVGQEWDVGWVQLGGGGGVTPTSDLVSNVVKNSF